MIPDFDENGNLPPGVHPAAMSEIVERFGRESEVRRAQAESLQCMIEAAVKAGVLRIVINGSYVSDVYEPNDVDCVLLTDDRYPSDESAAHELEEGYPFLSLRLVSEVVFQEYLEYTFASDRNRVPKGMVELIL